MLTSHPKKRYRCRYCGAMLPAWLPVAQRPEGSMLLYHLGQHHPKEVGPYLERMRTECIATVAAEAFEVVKRENGGIRHTTESGRLTSIPMARRRRYE